MRNTSDNTSQFYVPQELLQELGNWVRTFPSAFLKNVLQVSGAWL